MLCLLLINVVKATVYSRNDHWPVLVWFCFKLKPLLLFSRYIIWLRKRPLNVVCRSAETKQENHLSTLFKVMVTMSCKCFVRLPIVCSEKLQNNCLVIRKYAYAISQGPDILFPFPFSSHFFLHKSDRAFLVLVPVNLIYFQCPQALPSYYIILSVFLSCYARILNL